MLKVVVVVKSRSSSKPPPPPLNEDGNGFFVVVVVVVVVVSDDREETQGRRVRRSRFDGDGVWWSRDWFFRVGRVVGVVEPGRREIVVGVCVVLGKKNTLRVLFGG